MSLFGWWNDSDDVFDDDEDDNIVLVECDVCGTPIRWKDEQYICPDCGTIMSRGEFFNCIGANPPGPECLSCNNRYPGCTDCPYGYVDNEN